MPLNRSDNMAYEYLETNDKDVKELKKKDPDVDRKIRDFMCRNFYDIRTFGAVMTTFVKAALNCGQVRGPVQLGFTGSDPIISQEVTITRVAITTEKMLENRENGDGQKNIVPYYTAQEGYISANLARMVTGFSEGRSGTVMGSHYQYVRGSTIRRPRRKWRCAGEIVFKHSKELGDCPAVRLFRAVKVKKRRRPSPKYSDYCVKSTKKIPDGSGVSKKYNGIQGR